MGAWRRWQDWATVLLGVILFATPFIFGTTSDAASSWTAYVMGALLALGGLWSASTEEPVPGAEWIPLVLGAAVFVAPWILNFTAVAEMAWMSWIVGALAVLNSGLELLVLGQKPVTA